MSGWFSQVSQFMDDTFDTVMKQVNDAQSELQQEQQKFASEVALTQVCYTPLFICQSEVS